MTDCEKTAACNCRSFGGVIFWLKISVHFGSTRVNGLWLRLNGDLISEQKRVISAFTRLLIKEIDFGLCFEYSHCRSAHVLKFVKVSQELVEVKSWRFEWIVAVLHQGNHVWSQDIFELESFNE